jgi:NADPH-dependent 2,4-dienoyl-CoA reductase/sulfur reductase-like enzyme/rhodanese-related sulfurtransferase
MMDVSTVIIVGGVAGGASCAARLRRQDENVRIVMVEQGPFVSFANCGLPYYVGGVIEKEEELLLADPELFRQRFNVEARINEKVISIDRRGQSVRIRRLADDSEYDEHYDHLVLSPGARPLRPALPGIDLPGIFSLRTVPDSKTVKTWIRDHDVRHAAVIGGGFIGLEMAENLANLGISVTLVERDAQLMPPLDKEMTIPVKQALEKRGIGLLLCNSVSAFEEQGRDILVRTSEGPSFPVQMVLLSIGLQPQSELARDCGLALGPRGHIVVDSNLRTGDRRIFAIGDAVEVRHAVSGQKTAVPLAGPANRQGRIVADVIAGRGRFFRGVQGTAVCGFFDLTMAMTGVNEKTLKESGVDYDVVYAHPNHHVGYFPGAVPIYMKLLFDRSSGRVLGAQAVGEAGVERRIDVISMTIQMHGTVFDLEEAELCYAPQYGAAKDPVNMIGMIAANVMRGDLVITPWTALGEDNAVILDVRDDDEIACKPIAQEVHIPINQLRGRLTELPKDRPIQVCCAVGARAYNAVRMLMQHGYQASLLSGGAETWFCVQDARSG